MKNKSVFWLAALLIFLALGTRFWRLAEPEDVVFDEVHFGKFISSYFTGEYFFDIHPPTGKLLIAGTAAIFGYRPENNPNLLFDHIGQPFDPDDAFALRFLSALAGSVLVILVFSLARALGASPPAAFFAGALAVFDNALTAQSRFAFLDTLLISFGLAAVIAAITATRSSKKSRFVLAALSGALSGLSVGVKMTGAVFGAVTVLVFFLEAARERSFSKFLKSALLVGTTAIVVYALPFVIHFKLLPQSGPGNAFMTPEFNASLTGNSVPAETNPSGFFKKFIELNVVMYRANAGLAAEHFNGSKWYEWPVMRRPVWYWSKEKMGELANIYFIGNPAVWLLVLAALPISLFMIRWGALSKDRRRALGIVLFGFLINLLLFVFVKRVSFLYHYLPSLAFGIVLAALLFESLGERLARAHFKKTKIAAVIAAYFAIFLAFLVVAPLTYGLFLSPDTNAVYQKIVALFD